MKRFIFLLLAFLSLQVQGQIRSKKVFIGKIPCVIWTPANFDSSKVYPWVVALHGAGEVSADGSDAQLTSKIVNNYNFSNLLSRADRLGFLVVQPQLVLSLNEWMPGFRPAYINQAINYALANYKVDPQRMYMTGLSMGGGACWEYVTSSIENANRVAALIPICGTWISGDWRFIGSSNIPVWAFHAADDETVSVKATQQAISNIKASAAKPEPRYTEYAKGGHAVWGTAYGTDALYTWMLSQTNSNIVPDPTPQPVPFKPTHKIIRKDGGIDSVRIETL
ncbi:dienelactone hydrolase family protein [Paraflavitalea sp. CAU 1676]|uniref:carboxylesterase family protein n=1 Tax=Paraflavitalea sp. CAU 1676 TaxID=3032598 RepID=UPI0023DBF271|nr:dienelactone hydrolase family protein [Paraflavitalea sp. CAU 1676]MDF2189275.1 dienelactone hydrolase family protein [Paraflavitalea sp. CAU 1676]